MKDRSQSLKFKMLVKQRHPEVKNDSQIQTLPDHDRALAMLLVHNMKIGGIIKKYEKEMDLKK